MSAERPVTDQRQDRPRTSGHFRDNLRPSGSGPLVARPIQLVGYVLLAGVVAVWTWRAFHDSAPRDTGLAYNAGVLAWATGHPEHLATWNGMTFLVAAFALVGRVFSSRTTADLITLLNVVLPVGAIGAVMYRLRGRVGPVSWWVAAFGLVSFVPMMSTVWWKQFNVIALVLAIGGFELARRGRAGWAAFATGLSVSVKPLLFPLPLVLLVRRDTRRVGLLSIAWVVGLDVASQALLALRAHNLATLDPTIGVRNLLTRTNGGSSNIFLCHPLNFSPTSTLCRLNGGFAHWTAQRIAVYIFVGVLALWVIGALRGRSALSWEVFAFVCPFGAMLSALAWSHYQVVLAPLFLLLYVRFVRDGAELAEWAGLALAFVLASMMWEPYGTILSTFRGTSPNPLKPTFLEEYAQFAQYALLLTGVIWYLRNRGTRAQAVPIDDRGAARPAVV